MGQTIRGYLPISQIYVAKWEIGFTVYIFKFIVLVIESALLLEKSVVTCFSVSNEMGKYLAMH